MTYPVPATPVLDLLREKRRELGIDSMATVIAARQGLVRRGSLIGAGLLGGVALLSGLVYLRHQFIRGDLAKLAPVEAEFQSLAQQNAQQEATINRQATANRDIAAGLTTVRTSSALLTDLQLRTPEGVQLSSAVVQGPSLVLKGQSADPMAFARINALQLELKRSPLLDATGISLVKSERIKQEAAGQAKNPAGPMPVGFEIRGPFASLEPGRQLDLMRQLGSDGMARRLQLLQSEGLIP
jgi:type IV pilus assembly protein PilN